MGWVGRRAVHEPTVPVSATGTVRKMASDQACLCLGQPSPRRHHQGNKAIYPWNWSPIKVLYKFNIKLKTNFIMVSIVHVTGRRGQSEAVYSRKLGTWLYEKSDRFWAEFKEMGKVISPLKYEKSYIWSMKISNHCLMCLCVYISGAARLKQFPFGRADQTFWTKIDNFLSWFPAA